MSADSLVPWLALALSVASLVWQAWSHRRDRLIRLVLRHVRFENRGPRQFMPDGSGGQVGVSLGRADEILVVEVANRSTFVVTVDQVLVETDAGVLATDVDEQVDRRGAIEVVTKLDRGRGTSSAAVWVVSATGDAFRAKHDLDALPIHRKRMRRSRRLPQLPERAKGER